MNSAVVFLLAVPLLAQAQERTEPEQPTRVPADTTNVGSITFTRFLDTYRWTGILALNRAADSTTVAVRERFFSTIIRTDRKFITDEQELTLDARHQFQGFSARAYVSSYVLSDDKSVAIGKLASHGFYGGIGFRPVEFLEVSPLAGIRFENQVDQQDRGPSYMLLVSTPEAVSGRTSLNGRWQYDQLSPRTTESRYAQFVSGTSFASRSENRFQAAYYRLRRDFYAPAESTVIRRFEVTRNIDTRIEDAFGLSDTLEYGLTSAAAVRLYGGLFAREIDRETRYRYYAGNPRPVPATTTSELRFDGGVRTSYDPRSGIMATAWFGYQERDETHRLASDDSLTGSDATRLGLLEERKNNHSRRTVIGADVTAGLSPSDTIALTASSSLLRYDTPGAGNDDDRDELMHALTLAATHRINKHLRARVLATANLSHLVYLKLSANNTWTRIFRIAPRLEYAPVAGIASTNGFEVLANYTVYDFEYPSSPIHSFAFRQFSFVDSSTVAVTGRFFVDLHAQWRFYERGELHWESFSERPINYFEDRTYSANVRYMPSRSLLFSLGLRYFSQSRFGYSGEDRVLEHYLRSAGPTTRITWSTQGRTEFSFEGWYEHQSQTGLPNRSYSNMNMSLVVPF